METRAQWRAWLGQHSATSAGVWLVTWSKTSPHPTLTYDDLVEEALCFGWVDSLPRGIDDERTQLRITPRKRGSNWSRLNKERIQRLTAEGLMTSAGLAVVEAAKADGSWSALDDVENLVEPDDLRAKLDDDPEARRQWDGFPRSANPDLTARARSAPVEVVSRVVAARSWPTKRECGCPFTVVSFVLRVTPAAGAGSERMS